VIRIRDLTSLQDYADCVALQDETWGTGFTERVAGAILRVSQMIGGVAAGAFDEQERMVGFVFGMTGVRHGELVHWSDMLAVRDELRGRGIGERLKIFQRDKVMALGVRSMLWTFDPVQAKNANFNINHLGAMPIEYVVDMYGSNTGSALHGAFPTDRFIVKWAFQEQSTPRHSPLPISGEPPIANPAGDDGLPTASLLPTSSAHAGPVLVQVPTEFAVRSGPAAAMRWRLVVRDVMTAWLSAGYRVTGFKRPEGRLPYYQLDPGA
jgi:predicted GNAT superfamily acetyltransferase